MFTKISFRETITFEKIGFIICSVLVELGLAIWGAIELFNKCDNCSELHNSDLWKFGLATFIIQISFVGIFLIMLLIFTWINYFKESDKNKNPEENLDKNRSYDCHIYNV